MPNLDLAAIERALEEMTPEPWRAVRRRPQECSAAGYVGPEDCGGIASAIDMPVWLGDGEQYYPTAGEARNADLEGIALLRNAAPAMVAEIKRLRALKQAVVDAHAEAWSDGDIRYATFCLELLKVYYGAPCAVCGRTGPLIDSECPDCRH